MAFTDPKYLIKQIIDVYVTATPVFKDDNVTPASVLHVFEGTPDDVKLTFFALGYDIVFSYGEPRVRGTRQIQDVPVHFLMRYPVTITTVDKYTAGVIVCTATTMQAKGRTSIRNAVSGSAQSAVGVTPAYVLTVIEEQGINIREGGLNMWRTPYYCEWTTG